VIPRRRGLAWGLIVYGVLGIALVASGASIGLGLAERIEELATAAEGTLSAAAESTRAAADSFTSVDGSLEQANASATQAAALSREASATLGSLANAMSISILGAQPLLPLADDFNTSADQAEALAGTLDGVATSLGDTQTDVAVIGGELEELSRQIETLQSAATPGEAPQLRLFVVLLLAWITVPAVGALILGLSLLRRTPASG
jgi:hypothetical protein